MRMMNCCAAAVFALAFVPSHVRATESVWIAQSASTAPSRSSSGGAPLAMASAESMLLRHQTAIREYSATIGLAAPSDRQIPMPADARRIGNYLAIYPDSGQADYQGGTNRIALWQEGAGNTVTALQAGGSHEMLLVQVGDDQSITAIQTGQGNVMVLQQSGTRNAISAIQSGVTNTLGIAQAGNGNIVRATQR